MAGRTIPRHITYTDLEEAIEKTEGRSINALADYLHVKHSAIWYHFIFKPKLKAKYEAANKAYLGREFEEGNGKRLQEYLSTCRKNIPIADICRDTNLTMGKFLNLIDRYPEKLGNLFQGLYDGSRKMRSETLNRHCGKIDSAPVGSPLCKIDKRENYSSITLAVPFLREYYEKRHGRVRLKGFHKHD